jgi:hypothetical protein
MQDNREALLITYASGGSTPGDSYVVRPAASQAKSMRMWVSIILGWTGTTWEKLKHLKQSKMNKS